MLRSIQLFAVFVLSLATLTTSFAQETPKSVQDRDQYGGWKQIKSKPTGFFRVDQINRTWWALTPEGNGYFAIATDHVNYDVHWCEALGYAPYAKNVREKYKNDENAWAISAASRLKAWGFNLLGANNSPSVRKHGLAWTENLNLGTSFASKHYLVHQTDWTGFPDVFHPDFPMHCDEIASRACAPVKDDPWLFGYFIDNELEWFGKSKTETGLAEDTIKLPAGTPGKRAFIEMLKSKYRSISDFNDAWNLTAGSWEELDSSNEWNRNSIAAMEDKKNFVRLAAEKYFSITTSSIKKADPNHMVLGSRFAGSAPQIVDICGKYCEIVSFNRYGAIDLENETAPKLAEDILRWHEESKRPIMITEWSFPALDTKLPSRHGAGQRVATQKERALAFEIHQKTLFSLPYVVGSSFFMWVDQPALGISKSFPEDSNYGLVNENDEPYLELTQAASRVNRLVYDIHSGQTSEVGVDKPATAVGPEGVYVALYGKGTKLPAETDIAVKINDEQFLKQAKIRPGPVQTVAFKTKIDPGAHYLSVTLDPEKKLIEADRSDNKIQIITYLRSKDWESTSQSADFYRVPIGVFSRSPLAEKKVVIIPLRETPIIPQNREIGISALTLLDTKDRPVYFEILDSDNSKNISEGDELVFEATLGAGKTETYYMLVGRSSNFAEPTGEFVKGMARSEFAFDNGVIKLSKMSQSGELIESIKIGDIEIGKVEMLIEQNTTSGKAWIRPNKLREISYYMSKFLNRVVVGVEFSPTEEQKAEGYRRFLGYCTFDIFEKKPWFTARFEALYNLDTDILKLNNYFYFLQAAADDPKRIEPLITGIPFSGAWKNLDTGAVLGIFGVPKPTAGNDAPFSERPIEVNYWLGENGDQHSDAFVRVNERLLPRTAFEERGPTVYIFASIPKGEFKPWHQYRQEISFLPIFQAFKPEVKKKN